METDYIRIEEEFFESMKKDLIYEYIEMDESLVPVGHENKLIRYFNNIDSVWFSRSKITDEESYYYFGLRDEETYDDVFISLVLKFNKDLKKTNLRFNKGNVFLLCKVFDDEIVNKLPRPYLIGKNNNYYINLGKIGEKEVLNKIEILLKLFDFEISLNNNLKIKNLSEFKETDDIDLNNISIDLETIEFNFEVFKLKDFINKQDFDDDFINQLNEYLFTKDQDNNFKLNEELFFKSLTSKNIIDLIYETIYELGIISFEQFKVDFYVKRQLFYSNIQFPNKIELNLSLDNNADSDADENVNEGIVVDSGVNGDVVSENVSEDIVVDSGVNGDVVSENVSEDIVVDSDVDFNIVEVIPDDWIVNDVDLDENQQEIFEEFILLKDDERIEYESENYNLSENDLEVIFSRIKRDISLNIINDDEDFEDVLIEYFEQFYEDCNANNLSHYYEKIIDSSFYKNLLENYNFNDKDVEDINHKIKLDIKSKNLDKKDLINRFKIYFECKYFELNYKSNLDSIDKNKYMDEFNLSEKEINDIINNVVSKIENWYCDLSIFNESCEVIFDKCLNEKLDLIRSLARKEFEKRYETKDIIVTVLNVQDISDKHYNRLIEDIYWDIKGLIIKPEDINDDLIREYF